MGVTAAMEDLSLVRIFWVLFVGFVVFCEELLFEVAEIRLLLFFTVISLNSVIKFTNLFILSHKRATKVGIRWGRGLE